MEQYKKIGFLLLGVIAVASCTSLDPCGPLQPRKVRSPQPTDQIRSQSTGTILSRLLRPIRSVPSRIISTLANKAFIKMSLGISNRAKSDWTNKHFENLPHNRSADSSTRDTIKDLYAMKQYFDQISPSDESGLSKQLRQLICSIANAETMRTPIKVTLPVVTDSDFPCAKKNFCLRKRKYIVLKDIQAYLRTYKDQI